MDKIRILLVDDEEDLLKIVGASIASWGYDLIQALSCQEAMEAIRNQKPDLVILDYMMPGMDGIAVLGEIRKINSKIPVIMFTGYPEMDCIVKAGKLGVSGFVPKLGACNEPEGLLRANIRLVVSKLQKGLIS